MKELLRQRALTYSLLSKLYLKEVDENLLELLKSIDYSCFNDDTELDKGFKMLGESVSKTTPLTLLSLARDYARSFFGAGLAKNSGAYPYESVYTSKDHILMQDARDEVLGSYRQESVARRQEFSEPEDHIAFELEFMGLLCTKAEEALTNNDIAEAVKYMEKQKQFFKNHLNVWVPTFCDDLEKLAQEPFYKAAAIITKAFMGEEEEVLNETATI